MIAEKETASLPIIDSSQFFGLVDGVFLPVALALVMFGVGLSLQPQNFGRVLRARRAFLIGLGSMLFLVPTTGIAIAFMFGPTPALTMGLVLLATCPSGILSNVLTDIAKGDVALSISLSATLSLSYVVTLPIILHVVTSGGELSGLLSDIPFGISLLKIIGLMLAPVIFGMGLRGLGPMRARMWSNAIKRLGAFALLLIFGLIAWREQEALQTAFGSLLIIIVTMNLINIGIATVMSRLGRLTRKERIAVSIEHLMRQEGTATFVAVTLLGSTEMAIPMIVNTLVGMLASAVLVVVAGGDEK